MTSNAAERSSIQPNPSARTLPGSKRVGIIGGGQLGRFLCEAARGLGVTTTVLDPNPDCPASRYADELIVADYSDAAAADRLVYRSDYITFEIEAIPRPVLSRLADHARRGRVTVAPDPDTLMLLQNKSLQKQWLVRNGLPTNPFLVQNPSELDGPRLARRFGLPFVQKAQSGGYDGRGVQVIRTEDDLEKLWPTPSVFEPFLPEVRELAVLVARNDAGDTAVYDPVALEFVPAENILDWVVAPAGFSESVNRRAIAIAREAVTRLNTPGLFATEFFLLQDDSLLINEISPRVHNAGHHTLEACQTSQFEQHLRAVLGMPLGPTALETSAVMKNVLNDPSAPFTRGAAGSGTSPAGPHLHWYGKAPDRAWRKLGHITCVDQDVNLARQKAQLALAELRRTGNAGK